MDKFSLYPFIAPLLWRRQKYLRSSRQDITLEKFVKEIGDCDYCRMLAEKIWDNLVREQAFVRDFRPMPSDDLQSVFAMGSEEVRFDLIKPIADQIDFDLTQYDDDEFDFRTIKTPRDVAEFFKRKHMKCAE